ncbi:hypothetical protein B296_00003188, partial [Ensete ventricosum]
SVQPVTQDITEDMHKDYPISGDEIRTRFLNFYASRGHKILPSASLVPDDPTVLLTIAGMLQFKPIFLGKVSSCIECTGSLSDWYVPSIPSVIIRFHFLYIVSYRYKLPPERLWISVFKDDDEAFSIWHDEVRYLMY